MQPAFFRAIGPWLPFTYGINAMREVIGGFYDGAWAGDVATLLGGSIGVDEYAQWAGMNRNEALSRLNGRAPRVYTGGEEK